MENFFLLNNYFYLDAKPNRIEGNIIGLIINDMEKLYNFCNNSISYLEDCLFEIENEEFAFCLYEIYSKFITFNIRLQKIIPKIQDFVDLFLISLPEFYVIDKEKNSKIEKYFLEHKKKSNIKELNTTIYLKNLNLPKNGDLLHTHTKEDELINQSFFTEINEETEEEEEFKKAIELKEQKPLVVTKLDIGGSEDEEANIQTGNNNGKLYHIGKNNDSDEDIEENFEI